jgi:hypothetical protein
MSVFVRKRGRKEEGRRGDSCCVMCDDTRHITNYICMLLRHVMLQISSHPCRHNNNSFVFHGLITDLLLFIDMLPGSLYEGRGDC